MVVRWWWSVINWPGVDGDGQLQNRQERVEKMSVILTLGMVHGQRDVSQHGSEWEVVMEGEEGTISWVSITWQEVKLYQLS